MEPIHFTLFYNFALITVSIQNIDSALSRIYNISPFLIPHVWFFYFSSVIVIKISTKYLTMSHFAKLLASSKFSTLCWNLLVLVPSQKLAQPPRIIFHCGFQPRGPILINSSYLILHLVGQNKTTKLVFLVLELNLRNQVDYLNNSYAFQSINCLEQLTSMRSYG